MTLDLVLNALDKVSTDLDFDVVDRIKDVFLAEFRDLSDSCKTTGLIDTIAVRQLIDSVNQ